MFIDMLDPGIAEYVAILCAAGVETYESCQGGDGHALPHPTVCSAASGLRAGTRSGWRRSEAYRSFHYAGPGGLL